MGEDRTRGEPQKKLQFVQDKWGNGKYNISLAIQTGTEEECHKPEENNQGIAGHRRTFPFDLKMNQK